MLRTLFIVGIAIAGFGFLLHDRNILDPDPIVWVLPAACAFCIGMLWD